MDKLKLIVEILKELDDPKYSTALGMIGQVCLKKADVLKNLESIQVQYQATVKQVGECNKELETYANGVK